MAFPWPGGSWLWSPSIWLVVSPRCESSLPEADGFFSHTQVCELSVELKLQSQRFLRFRAANEMLGGLESPLGPRWVTPGVGHTTTALPGESQQRAPEELRDLLRLSLCLPSQVRSCSICISSRCCVHVWLWSRLLGALPWVSGSLLVQGIRFSVGKPGAAKGCIKVLLCVSWDLGV